MVHLQCYNMCPLYFWGCNIIEEEEEVFTLEKSLWELNILDFMCLQGHLTHETESP